MTELKGTDVKTEEEVEATNITTDDEVQYEIVDGDMDGVKVRGVRANGNLLFTVSEGFSNDQVQEVFNLGNKFFNDGLRFGVVQKEAQFQQLLGITPALIQQLAAVQPEAGEAPAA